MAILSEDEKKRLLDKLENDGEEKVKANLAGGIYAQWKKPFIENWLEQKERERQTVLSKKDLEIKMEANKIAKNQNLISWIAICISILSLIVALVAVWKK